MKRSPVLQFSAASLAMVAALSTHAVAWPTQPAPVYGSRTEIQQLAANVESQVQYIVTTAQHLSDPRDYQQTQALQTLQQLQFATTQLRLAVEGWNGAHDRGYDELLRVNQLQDQAEQQAYAFYYGAQDIRESLNQVDESLARLNFLYRRGGDTVNGRHGLLNLVRELTMQLSTLENQVQYEADYYAIDRRILREVREALAASNRLERRIDDRFDDPYIANAEFLEVRTSLDLVRQSIYQGGFSTTVHQQLNLVIQRVRTLAPYFQGSRPVVVRPIVRHPGVRPRLPVPIVRPPVRRGPPVIVPVHPGQPRRGGRVIVNPPVGPRRPVVVTPVGPGRPPRHGGGRR